MKPNIEIPFGAFDSELKGWEYTIPEGYTAEIKDGKIIVKEKESEDERINKAIFKALSKKDAREVLLAEGIQVSDALAYLEKQKEQNLIMANSPQLKEQKPAVSREEILYQLLQNNSITMTDYLYLTNKQKLAEWGAKQNKKEQAEKNTIERAISWLKEHANEYIVDVGVGYGENGRNVELVVGGMCWEHLKKAMED